FRFGTLDPAKYGSSETFLSNEFFNQSPGAGSSGGASFGQSQVDALEAHSNPHDPTLKNPALVASLNGPGGLTPLYDKLARAVTIGQYVIARSEDVASTTITAAVPSCR
ncbi:MAG TPA: hypothetical protein VIJ77_05810, partial [Candidatus Tumulicola sp.]